MGKRSIRALRREVERLTRTKRYPALRQALRELLRTAALPHGEVRHG